MQETVGSLGWEDPLEKDFSRKRGYPLQYSGLENSMDCIVHGVAESDTTEQLSLSIYQGIFPTHGSNPGLPHCRRILYQLSHKGSPRILEWVDFSFSRGSS